jgi:hypothetical protein
MALSNDLVVSFLFDFSQPNCPNFPSAIRNKNSLDFRRFFHSDNEVGVGGSSAAYSCRQLLRNLAARAGGSFAANSLLIIHHLSKFWLCQIFSPILILFLTPPHKEADFVRY